MGLEMMIEREKKRPHVFDYLYFWVGQECIFEDRSRRETSGLEDWY